MSETHIGFGHKLFLGANMSNISPPADTNLPILNGAFPAYALLAGMQLDLFTTLKHGPLTAYVNNYENGHSYTEQQYRDWFTEAGFIGFEGFVPLDDQSVLIARKPA